MPQRFLSEDEMGELQRTNQGFWILPAIFTAAAVLTGVSAFNDPLSRWLFFLFASIAACAWGLARRKSAKFSRDLENRVAEVVEGTPQRVWMLGRNGPCYITIAGKTIRVPSSCYEELKQAYLAKVTFLPESKIALRVESGRGIAV